MVRRVTSPRRVTLPTWGPPPPCKLALKGELINEPFLSEIHLDKFKMKAHLKSQSKLDNIYYI